MEDSKSVVVELTEVEANYAGAIALCRETYHLMAARPREPDMGIVGVEQPPYSGRVRLMHAELAVAKYLDVYWMAGAGWLGGFVQVRVSDYSGRLLVQLRDPDCTALVLVTGWFPRLVLRGWITGQEGRQDRFAVPGGHPRYAVPQEELLPMTELRRTVDRLRYDEAHHEAHGEPRQPW